MLILLTQPSEVVEPVTLAEAKAHLRVIHSSDDGLIAAQITAAREYAERFTGLAMALASWRETFDCFAWLKLSLFPASAIDAVTYLDNSGVRQTVAATDYAFDGDRNTVTPVGAWPSGSAVNVDFSTDPQGVPEQIKQAIVLLVKADYEGTKPEEAEGYRKAAEAKMHPFRLGLGV